jgi:saccharopine dehydrogenase (NAD+, L-lysine forming)
MKFGIIREGKNPPDNRVALTPKQCRELQSFFGFEMAIQRSPNRCFSDAEYAAEGLNLTEDLSDCEVLLGVKEVPIEQLIPNKTYFFFSHTIKQQPYNRGLLQAILAKNIRIIDYEMLTNKAGQRLIAFGFYAGVVGAHNGFWTWAKRTGDFELPRMKDCHDYAEVLEIYKKTKLPALKIVLTGGGRVAQGALKVLHDLKIQQVSATDFLGKNYSEAVFTQLHAENYAARKNGTPFQKADFYKNGHDYASIFMPFAEKADIFLNGIFYDKAAPAFFSLKEMASPNFKIQVIADITCDIMPGSSVPATVRAATIADPVFGFDAKMNAEIAAFSQNGVDMMTVDNLPNELPRDASKFFGRQFLENILPELIKPSGTVIDRATIARDGKLTSHYDYLADFVA